jgi:hypothetical protein
VQIDALTTRIELLIAAIPARGIDADGTTGPHAGTGPDAAVLAAIDRLDAIPGISRHAAQMILAATGLDMSIFPTAGHLVSGAKLVPRTVQSGAKSRSGKTGKGNPYLKGASSIREADDCSRLRAIDAEHFQTEPCALVIAATDDHMFRIATRNNASLAGVPRAQAKVHGQQLRVAVRDIALVPSRFE